MEVILVIIITIAIFIIFTGKDEDAVKNNNKLNPGYGNHVVKSSPSVIPVKSSSISVTPNKIVTNPPQKLSLIDGEYRYFENYYIDGKQYTFGFPKANCRDKRVWIGVNKDEHGRVSDKEAKEMIRNNSVARLYSKNQNYGGWSDSYNNYDLPF